MSFASVVGQLQPIEILRRAIAEDRIAHAYLFVGPPNVGKTLAATEFAKAVNCEARVTGVAESDIEPCERCHNCARIDQENHPDLMFLRPAVKVEVRESPAEKPASGGVDEDPVEGGADQARTRTGKRDVYIELPDALIDTERVLDVVQYAYAKPAVGPRKFVVIVSADAMNAEAANRLLKTLEEPPPATTFVLTTSRPDSLLPTIVSRCQVVRFQALSQSALRAALEERSPGADAELLEAATAMAGGRFGRALLLMRAPELMRLRAELLDLAAATADLSLAECLPLGERLMAMPERWWAASEGAEAAEAPGSDSAASRLEALEALAKKSPDRINRIQMQQILDVLQTWFRDLTLLRSYPESRAVINADRRDQLAPIAAGFSPAGLVWASEVIEDMRRDLAVHNANLRLACQVLMVKLIAARRRQ